MQKFVLGLIVVMFLLIGLRAWRLGQDEPLTEETPVSSGSVSTVSF
ncbi:hypothetical protein [Rubinisphaera margarita]|nr:hypothetical protein [Rubinisphaera margarita]MCG6157486.1 hypothetical protein [Rubinisphaera margarita]